MQKLVKFMLVAVLAISSVINSAYARGTVLTSINIGKKEVVLYTRPVKVKTIISLAPSAMGVFIDYAKDYFKFNDWGLGSLKYEFERKRKLATFNLISEDTGQGEFEAFQFEVKKKVKRLELRLIATKEFIKRRKDYLQAQGTYPGHKQMIKDIETELNNNLEDIKSYW